MQEIRFSHFQAREMPGWRRAGARLALICGALGLVSTLVFRLPWWLGVVFLLLMAGSLALRWFEASGRVRRYSSSVPPGYWQDWLAGWYWETDAEHRLVLLKPDDDDSESWRAVQQLTREPTPWWACWGRHAEQPLAEAHHVALTQLETRLKARLPLDIDGLPWPLRDASAPSDASNALAGGAWHIVGAPRLDASGRFLGHHGVWRRKGGQANTGASVASAAEPAAEATEAPLTEAEQEVLRYALSHDLRAPLRVVDGFSRIIKEDYGRFMDRIGNDHLDRVLAATARMNGMIDAILAQAQLSTAPLQRARVDLTALARDVAQEQRAARHADLIGMTPTAPLLDVEFTVAEGLAVEADPLLVRRIFENLIGNALKYSSKVAHPRIEVGAVPATHPCVFFVRDNGAGFDMQHAEKLFGLFQRLHSARDFPGTGVGLAGVQNIVRRHGGRVWAESAPGQGACFYFTLSGQPG